MGLIRPKLLAVAISESSNFGGSGGRRLEGILVYESRTGDNFLGVDDARALPKCSLKALMFWFLILWVVSWSLVGLGSLEVVGVKLW